MGKNNEQTNQQDAYIKGKLKEDQITDQSIFDRYANTLIKSKVKASTFSYKKQLVLILFLMLLILGIAFFFADKYFGIIEKIKVANLSSTTDNTVNDRINDSGHLVIPDNTPNKEDDENTITNTPVVNNTVDNTISNTTNTTTNSIKNTNSTEVILPSSNVILDDSTDKNYMNLIASDTEEDYSKIKIEDLTQFISSFAIGIERLNFNEETLESNTILLYVAKHFFDTSSDPKSLTFNSDYAATAENIHKFLTEFTGKDYTKVDYIRSYNNFVGYADHMKSYISGKDLSKLTVEKYSVSDVEITNEFNKVYTAKAKVVRTREEETTSYQITFDFTINQNPKYQKYCLKKLSAINLSYYPDNTVHLVDISE